MQKDGYYLPRKSVDWLIDLVADLKNSLLLVVRLRVQGIIFVDFVWFMQEVLTIIVRKRIIRLHLLVLDEIMKQDLVKLDVKSKRDVIEISRSSMVHADTRYSVVPRSL